MDGSNHVAMMSAALGDDADVVIAAMDNLNAGLAFVHQDAFKNVYDSLKEKRRDSDRQDDTAKLYVDIAMQKNMADMAIDKMSSSALTLINEQDASIQEDAANAWLTGVTIVADAMEVSLKKLDELDSELVDFVRLEASWNVVKASVMSAITGLKGVYRLMDQTDLLYTTKAVRRSSSIADATGQMWSASGSVFRRLSNAFVANPAGPADNSSRTSSISSAEIAPSIHGRSPSVNSFAKAFRTPNYMRNSITGGCPTTLPSGDNLPGHKLSPIPPTPAAHDLERDPFDTTFAPPVPSMPQFHALPALPSPSLEMDPKRFSLSAF